MAELTSNVNYLQPTGFAVTMSRENYPNLEYFAQSVSHPGVEIQSVEVPFRRVNQPFVGDKLQFGQIVFTFLVDEELKTYSEMYEWTKRIVQDPQVTNTESIQNTNIPTESDIVVSVLSSHNNIIKRIKYYNAFPVSISELELTTQQGDVTPLTFTSSFRFAYFELI